MHHADSQPTGKKILVLRTRLRPVREQIATRPQPTPNPDLKPSENCTSQFCFTNLLFEGDHTQLDLHEHVVGDLLLRIRLQLPNLVLYLYH
jgi:hypothetical protein